MDLVGAWVVLASAHCTTARSPQSDNGPAPAVPLQCQPLCLRALSTLGKAQRRRLTLLEAEPRPCVCGAQHHPPAGAQGRDAAACCCALAARIAGLKPGTQAQRRQKRAKLQKEQASSELCSGKDERQLRSLSSPARLLRATCSAPRYPARLLVTASSSCECQAREQMSLLPALCYRGRGLWC